MLLGRFQANGIVIVIVVAINVTVDVVVIIVVTVAVVVVVVVVGNGLALFLGGWGSSPLGWMSCGVVEQRHPSGWPSTFWRRVHTGKSGFYAVTARRAKAIAFNLFFTANNTRLRNTAFFGTISTMMMIGTETSYASPL